jgi:hypothetical protein
MYIVISTSTYDLWENNIDLEVFAFIYNHSENIRVPTDIYKLDRHHNLVINAFRSVYGYTLQKCAFAKLVYLPDTFMNFYEVERIECYKNVYYTESIRIHKKLWLRQEYNRIQHLQLPAYKKREMMEDASTLVDSVDY